MGDRLVPEIGQRPAREQDRDKLSEEPCKLEKPGEDQYDGYGSGSEDAAVEQEDRKLYKGDREGEETLGNPEGLVDQSVGPRSREVWRLP